MFPKNSRSALAALLFAGGLWAYRNRDKVRGWMDRQMSSRSDARLPSGQPYTGATTRFDEGRPAAGDFGSEPRDPFAADI